MNVQGTGIAALVVIISGTILSGTKAAENMNIGFSAICGEAA